MANLRTSAHEHRRRLLDADVPMGVFGCRLPDMAFHHTIAGDTSLSAKAAVEHLLELGHREIAFVNFARPEDHAVNDREPGWRDALADYGIEANPAWLAYADISAQSGYEATREPRQPGDPEVLRGAPGGGIQGQRVPRK